MPASDKPEQISALQPNWDSTSQSVNVSLSSQLSNAGDQISGLFQLRGTTSLVVGEQTFTLTAEQPFEVVEVDGNNNARVKPLRLPWDRNGGAVTGLVKVSGTVTLVNPGGQVVDTDTFEGDIDAR